MGALSPRGIEGAHGNSLDSPAFCTAFTGDVATAAGGELWVGVHPVKRPTGWSPDAPSQSNVDGTVAQCAAAISVRDVAIDVVGTPVRWPCRGWPPRPLPFPRL